MTDRPAQRDCRYEPPYPDHFTVLISIGNPDWTCHLASPLCSMEHPHPVSMCREFYPGESPLTTRDWNSLRVSGESK